MHTRGNDDVGFAEFPCIVLSSWEKVPVEQKHIENPVKAVASRRLGFDIHKRNLFQRPNFVLVLPYIHSHPTTMKSVRAKYRRNIFLPGQIPGKPKMSPTMLNGGSVMIPQPHFSSQLA